jgi:hypothetical protein
MSHSQDSISGGQAAVPGGVFSPAARGPGRSGPSDRRTLTWRA